MQRHVDKTALGIIVEAFTTASLFSFIMQVTAASEINLTAASEGSVTHQYYSAKVNLYKYVANGRCHFLAGFYTCECTPALGDEDEKENSCIVQVRRGFDRCTIMSRRKVTRGSSGLA